MLSEKPNTSNRERLAGAVHNAKVVRLSPERDGIARHVEELWDYRELILNFVLRDLTTRYKQTILGVAWALIQPIFMMAVFAVFFGKFMHTSAENCPYPIFALAGVLVWQYVSAAVGRVTNSLLGAGSLMKKVYFPKLTVPISSVVLPAVDFSVGFLLFLCLMPLYGVVPSARVLLLPLYLVLMFGTALGIGFWTSALHVKYRDIFHIVPFALQLWLFASPVAYSSAIVPAHLQSIFYLNPLVGIIEGTRWCLLDTATNVCAPTLFAAAVSSLLVASGLLYFLKSEDAFADYV